jgi:hypothetical protein
MLPERVVASSNPQDYAGVSGKTKKWKPSEAKWVLWRRRNAEREQDERKGGKKNKEQERRRRKGINSEGDETDWFESGENQKRRAKRGSVRME